MKLESSQIICGVSARQMRDALRHLGFRHFKAEALTERASGIDVNAMLRDGIIVRTDHDTSWFTATAKGRQIACAKFVRRLTRAQADSLFEAFMKRVREVNRSNDFVLEVSELVLFGSYIDEQRNDIGDIDLAMSLKKKAKFQTWGVGRCADYTDRRFSLPYRLECWDIPDYAARRFLRARSPYLQFQHMEDFKSLNTPGRKVEI